MVIMTIVVLILELLICYLMGSGLVVLVKQEQLNIALRMVIGFLFVEALFEIPTILFTLADLSFSRLVFVWRIILGLLLLLFFCIAKKRLVQDFKEVGPYFRKNGKWMIAGFLMMTLMCIYVSVNGELNYDSEYYIGLVTTTIETDSLFKYNVYTGLYLPSLYFRRALVSFEIHTAAICKTFGLQPILGARILRGSSNVILTGAAIYTVGKTLFAGKENPVKQAWFFTILVYLCYFAYESNMYTNGEFFLHRCYEGKAFAGNVLIYFFICLAMELSKNHRKGLLLLWMVSLWGCLAISSTAVVICLVESVILWICVFLGGWIHRMRKASE